RERDKPTHVLLVTLCTPRPSTPAPAVIPARRPPAVQAHRYLSPSEHQSRSPAGRIPHACQPSRPAWAPTRRRAGGLPARDATVPASSRTGRRARPPCCRARLLARAAVVHAASRDPEVLSGRVVRRPPSTRILPLHPASPAPRPGALPPPA